MPVTVFFAAGAAHWDRYRPHLQAACIAAGLDVTLSDRADDPGLVDYIIYSPGSVLTDFSPYVRCKAVLNLWAGVERIVGNATLTQPLCKMVDPAMTSSMAVWVTGHALRHHLGIDAHILGQDGIWRGGVAPPLAHERTVAILGIGELGRAAGQMLRGVGFRVVGWSRSARTVPGIECHSGSAGLETVLRQADILVLLIPLTPDTENLLDAARLALMPRGAFIINSGRGPLIDDAALLGALDSGQIAHATLDVFRTEPLPPQHPFWAHPGVTVTPHIAAETRPDTAARVIAENIRRGEAQQPLLHRVDRTRGY